MLLEAVYRTDFKMKKAMRKFDDTSMTLYGYVSVSVKIFSGFISIYSARQMKIIGGYEALSSL